jgi:hypothetical protein
MSARLVVSCCRDTKWLVGAVFLLAALVLGGCATGAPPGRLFPGLRPHRLTPTFYQEGRKQPPAADSARASASPAAATAPDEDDPEDDLDEEEGTSAAVAEPPEASSGSRARRPEVQGEESLADWGGGQVGWRDGVGEGRPRPAGDQGPGLRQAF